MEIYACYNKDERIRRESSSGGVFALFAEEILNDGGVVFSVCYDKDFETIHKKITSMEMLRPSLGSKYIQSKLLNTFKELKNCLLSEQKVLFVGTPCQCAGLKAFLGQEFEKLWLIDLVCHGVPSKVAWRKYLKDISDEDIDTINMRDKTSGWSEWNYSWSVRYKNGKNFIIPQDKVSFMQGFVRDYYLRPSCYECYFKGVNRISDITIGDYWGVWDVQPNMDDDKGTSIVIVHSDKGQNLLNQINGKLKISEADVENVIKYNPSIVESAKKTQKREKFFERIKSKESFGDIIEDLMKVDKSNTLLSRMKVICNSLSIYRR